MTATGLTEPTIVVDTNVLLNLATPVVDASDRAASGDDPLKTVLSAYDVHVPDVVLGEVTDASTGSDPLSTAATAVLWASEHLTTHAIDERIGAPLDYGLDTGESYAIWLANDLDAAMFVTDEFGRSNYLFVALALDDRNTLFTTPHVLCTLGRDGVIDSQYVDAVLTYYEERKGWDGAFLDQLRERYLRV
ncbi:hypothetical protein [Halococcoides cellulosivorans]|uniref:PIN domain-containing protein n=1 Tax=Halococcoides cellulosivorans TaxID=1679096 RepID=A0A2R4X2E9_9EURY|nr:hypothetical protein [Halococcoides cellulosivorans]AWB27989.1 hypothetical protein HARCEL1_09850 [Halococcoides cellulosivorans]